MPQSLAIRRAAPAEAGALTALALASKAHWGYDEAFMAACAEELTVRPDDIRRREVWLVEAGGRPVGFYELVPGQDGPGSGELRLLFVAPSHIGTGLGRRLWRHMEARARALGVGRIGLDADPFARPFYERMGARVVGSSPSGSIPGRRLPRMEMALGAPARP